MVGIPNYFRAFKSAVSLKPEAEAGEGVRLTDFRAFKSAVSLKRGGAEAADGGGGLFPRLQKRGLIEAVLFTFRKEDGMRISAPSIARSH